MDWRIPEKLKKGVSYARFSTTLRSMNGNVKGPVLIWVRLVTCNRDLASDGIEIRVNLSNQRHPRSIAYKQTTDDYDLTDPHADSCPAGWPFSSEDVATSSPDCLFDRSPIALY